MVVPGLFQPFIHRVNLSEISSARVFSDRVLINPLRTKHQDSRTFYIRIQNRDHKVPRFHDIVHQNSPLPYYRRTPAVLPEVPKAKLTLYHSHCFLINAGILYLHIAGVRQRLSRINI